MRHIRLLVGAGLVALVFSLVALLPARVGFALLGVPAAAVGGLSGTLWHGAAQRLAIDGIALGPVRWQARPWRLFLAQLAAGVEATLPDGFLNGTIVLSPTGRIVLRDLKAAAPLVWLAPAAGGGQLTARFDRLELHSGRIEAALGSLQLADFVLPLATAGAKLAPGTYTVTFDGKAPGPDEPLTGLLKDSGGPLEIAGTVKVTPPRSYELTGTAKPRPEAPPELRNALQMLGPATPDGGHALSVAGSF